MATITVMGAITFSASVVARAEGGEIIIALLDGSPAAPVVMLTCSIAVAQRLLLQLGQEVELGELAEWIEALLEDNEDDGGESSDDGTPSSRNELP